MLCAQLGRNAPFFRQTCMRASMLRSMQGSLVKSLSKRSELEDLSVVNGESLSFSFSLFEKRKAHD